MSAPLRRLKCDVLLVDDARILARHSQTPNPPSCSRARVSRLEEDLSDAGQNAVKANLTGAGEGVKHQKDVGFRMYDVWMQASFGSVHPHSKRGLLSITPETQIHSSLGAM